MCAFRFEAWPTEYRTINQYFGANPANYAQFGLPGHEGVDIMAPHGSRVFAVAPGRVTRVRTLPTGHNYGRHIVLSHEEGFRTTYAHLHEVHVAEGADVVAGQAIGLADDTGNSFGSHLHLTLKRDGATFGNWPFNIMDPTPFLLPLLGLLPPAGPFVRGWAFTAGIFLVGEIAQVSLGGINLRAVPSVNGDLIALVPSGTVVVVTGGSRGQYTPVDVPAAAIGQVEVPSTPPLPPPPPTVATVDGWGSATGISVVGDQAVVGQFGINLRQGPDQSTVNIGLVGAGVTATVLGDAQHGYVPLRVRREDFLGSLILPVPPPVPVGSPAAAPPGAVLGWAATAYLTPLGGTALAHRFGVNLRERPAIDARRLGLIKGLATVTVCGQARADFTPVITWLADVLSPLTPMPAAEVPDPLPNAPPEPRPETNVPPQWSVPGWAATAHITLDGLQAIAGMYGINLRDAPSRAGSNLGMVPAGASMFVTGPAQGEYTPVRVDRDILRPPFDPATAPPVTDTTRPPDTDDNMDPDPPLLGRARIGLHASADPGDLTEQEMAEFTALRPTIIKVLSAHSSASISRLASSHPDASWIVRAFLHFGGRQITPEQFVRDTLTDVSRALDALPGRDAVIELHNEPNLSAEGLGSTWADGAQFATWFLDVLARYRVALPGRRFVYPGLSPGSAVSGLKQDHIRFIEASRSAVEAADGLAVHIYWSQVYPMSQAIAVLDDYIARFRYAPLWITEASNNKPGTAPHIKGRQYLDFWQELQHRPTVQGVTYFVASASDPAFGEETWVQHNLGHIVGRR